MATDQGSLRLLAEDAEDLAVISAALQDAVGLVGDIAFDAKTQRLTLDNRVLDVSIISTALIDARGKMYGIATTERAKAPVVG